MPKKRLLVWGKTAPEFSKTYYETVCTGAVDVETGNLLRIYPITMRHHEKQFKKYTFIDAEIDKRGKNDPRPESFRIEQSTIEVHETIGFKDGWAERSSYVLKPQNVFSSVESLLAAQQSAGTSLGLVAPKEIKRFYSRQKSKAERAEWEEKRAAAAAQRDLFVDNESELKELKFMPIEYLVEFVCDDPACSGHNCSIRDWEVYVLSLKQYAARSGHVAQVEQDVYAELRKRTDPTKKRPYFFMGNTVTHPQRFMVVGIFSPALELNTPAGKKVTRAPAAPSNQGTLF
jgi:hypothetical protein